MSKNILYFFLSFLLLTGCDEKKGNREISAKDLQEQAKKSADKTAEFIKKENSDLKKNLDDRLSQLDKKIDELKAKKGSSDKSYDEKLHELEIKRDELKSKFKKAGDNAEENWEEFKKESNEAFKNIEEKIDALKK